MLDKKIQDALDACRPNHDDLQLPELGILAEALASQPELDHFLKNSRRLDSQISRAMHDVPVPVSLASSLLQSVRKQAHEQVSDQLAHQSPATLVGNIDGDARDAQSNCHQPEPLALPRVVRRLRQRRWVIRAAVVVAVSVFVAIGWNWMHTSAVWTQENLVDQAPRWVADLPNDWQPAGTLDSAAFPVESFVLTPPRGWQSFVNSRQQRGIVIDLQGNRGAAFLFVFRAPTDKSLTGLPTRLPSTGGWGLGAWQSGGLVYVLLVNERQQRLDHFMRSSSPLA